MLKIVTNGLYTTKLILDSLLLVDASSVASSMGVRIESFPQMLSVHYAAQFIFFKLQTHEIIPSKKGGFVFFVF